MEKYETKKAPGFDLTQEPEKRNHFEEFTNLYPVTKTLRFALDNPVGESLENLKKDFDKEKETFIKDQKIEDAYQVLKPKVDEIHEKLITDSLNSDLGKGIDFKKYWNLYEETKRKNEKTINKEIGKKIEKEENELRKQIGKTYSEGGEILKKDNDNIEWKKGGKIVKGEKMLSCPAVLDYLNEKHSGVKTITKAIKEFKGFFTALSGFNTNRENYYTTKEEKATAVATRIVHENLPKFCANKLLFEKDKERYLEAFVFFKKQNKVIENKSGNKLSSIEENIFCVSYFNDCLSQTQIEEYNAKIGNNNSIINLYNQAHDKDKKLDQFKMLYKQIGCGKRKPLFFKLTHDTKKEATENNDNQLKPYSVEQVLEQAEQAGNRFFKNCQRNNQIKTVYDFTEWLRNRSSWEGIYWSKAAVNHISNRYLANWHDILDKVKDQKTIASFDKKREEPIKINDAVELSGLFDVLDRYSMDQQHGWEQVFFKPSVLEWKNIDTKKSASQNLVDLLCEDIETNAKIFVGEKVNDKGKNLANVVKEIRSYKKEESKNAIKEWMECALNICRTIKNFKVSEGKVKGNSINSELENALETLLNDKDNAEWFKWHGALRNYLTKKPQDDAKENKLKLYFGTGNFLDGWSDGQEKSKKGVILKKDDKYFLGILNKGSLFDTSKNNTIYNNGSTNISSGRMILKNLKFQTLAGKGFIGKYKEKYSDMGVKDSQKAINCLKEIIKEKYIESYPVLEEIINKKYSDKSNFDKDIKKKLQESYTCKFRPVNWQGVEEAIKEGHLYLFQIYSKDFSNKSTGSKNLQTYYWQEVLKENSPHQLNGSAEIFYRKQAIKYSDDQLKKGHHHECQKKHCKEKGKPFFPIIKDKRFAKERFSFHFPITLNYAALGNPNPKYSLFPVNKKINEELGKKNDDVVFLGLDRGEKHLVYYCLINKGGSIIEQGSLNLEFTDKNGDPRSINKNKWIYDKQKDKWKKHEVDCCNYKDLLAVAEANRDHSRRSWQAIDSIKSIKEGYISQVINLIVKKVIEKPTFIVLEDLNTGFKRGRQKIERQVYQKFELALAKKLNFIVDKKAKESALGSPVNAIQLTPAVQNYANIENKKQIGIMFYTRANYTSMTDPVTGWRKSIYLKKGNEKEIKKQIDESFDDIGFDGKDYYLKCTARNTGKKWYLWSGKDGQSLTRYRGKRGKNKYEWIVKSYDIKKMLDDLFQNFDKKMSLKSQLIDRGIQLCKTSDNKTAWESLRYAIDLIQQIRNSNGDENSKDDNFLHSPVRNDDGKHYDSRKTESNEEPRDADANGAYNIARKGIIMQEHIKKWKENGEKKQDLNLFVSDEEWDLWLTKRETWEDKLEKFSSKEKMEEYRKEIKQDALK